MTPRAMSRNKDVTIHTMNANPMITIAHTITIPYVATAMVCLLTSCHRKAASVI